jgi:hypothetical protein
MIASRYDVVLPCPVCDDGNCRLCENGKFAYYAPAHPGEQDKDAIIYYVDKHNDGMIEKHVMNARNFNALVGDANLDPSENDEGNVTVAQDKADRLQNQLGDNAPYNTDVSASDMPNGWPSDPDLSPAEAQAWLRARGDTLLAQRLAETVRYHREHS